MKRDDMTQWERFEYGGPSPLEHEWIEIEREEWPGPQIVRVRDMNPMMNVAGLWWKPAID